MSNRKQIEAVTGQSAYKEELGEVFSDHFDDVTKPVSVSLGIYMNGKRIDEIVGMLRENGIDAMPYYDPAAAENPNAFIVDGTGVRSPFFEPADAIQAAADVFEVMKKNGLSTSRALPVTQDNLIPAVTRPYENQTIDIEQNNPDEKGVGAFMAKQLYLAAEKMPAVEPRSGKLYRGGTLGNRPFALTFHRCPRDAAYATKDFNMAATYADGTKGAGLHYKQTGGKSFGFIYEFEPKEGQRYYSMAGIERPEGSAECVGHADNRDDYETLIVPERNPLSAIYLKVDDKIVQIADEKGYVSEEWEKFSALTAPRDISENNDFMAARRNRQLNDGVTVVKYKKSDKPLPNDYKAFTPDIRGLVFGESVKTDGDKSEIGNAGFSSIKLPDDKGVSYTGDFFANNCVVGTTLDLSKCTGSVGLCDCDLSRVESIRYPESCNVFFLSNVTLPENGVLDLGKMKCHTMTLEDQDCTKLKRLVLPENATVKLKGTTKLPDGKDADAFRPAARKPLMQSLSETAVQNSGIRIVEPAPEHYDAFVKACEQMRAYVNDPSVPDDIGKKESRGFIFARDEFANLTRADFETKVVDAYRKKGEKGAEKPEYFRFVMDGNTIVGSVNARAMKMDDFDIKNGLEPYREWSYISDNGAKITTSTVILPEHRGKGIIGQAEKLFFDELKSKGIDEITSTVLSGNDGSDRAQKKLVEKFGGRSYQIHGDPDGKGVRHYNRYVIRTDTTGKDRTKYNEKNKQPLMRALGDITAKRQTAAMQTQARGKDIGR